MPKNGTGSILDLEELQIQSFVTELDDEKLKRVLGAGNGGITPQSDQCIDHHTGGNNDTINTRATCCSP